MKKLLISIALFNVSLSVNAFDPNFNTTTKIVTFPRVTVNNGTAYIDVKLLLDSNGQWSILEATPEPTLPENNIYPLVTSINSNSIVEGGIFSLEGGQLWISNDTRFTSDGNSISTEKIETVTIYKQNDKYVMSVNNETDIIGISPFQFQSKIESNIPTFIGLEYDNLIKLGNGSFWVVKDLEILMGRKDHTEYTRNNPNPSVTIYTISQKEHLLVLSGLPYSFNVELLELQ